MAPFPFPISPPYPPGHQRTITITLLGQRHHTHWQPEDPIVQPAAPQLQPERDQEIYMGVEPKIGGKPPKWMVKIMENLIKMDDLGVFPYFWKHPCDLWVMDFQKGLHPLKLTSYFAPENRPKLPPKGNGLVFQPVIFSCDLLVSGRVVQWWLCNKMPIFNFSYSIIKSHSIHVWYIYLHLPLFTTKINQM